MRDRRARREKWEAVVEGDWEELELSLVKGGSVFAQRLGDAEESDSRSLIFFAALRHSKKCVGYSDRVP